MNSPVVVAAAPTRFGAAFVVDGRAVARFGRRCAQLGAVTSSAAYR
jgi:uncharacterized Zn-binding protein involved in type VI secretion